MLPLIRIAGCHSKTNITDFGKKSWRILRVLGVPSLNKPVYIKFIMSPSLHFAITH